MITEEATVTRKINTTSTSDILLIGRFADALGATNKDGLIRLINEARDRQSSGKPKKDDKKTKLTEEEMEAFLNLDNDN